MKNKSYLLPTILNVLLVTSLVSCIHADAKVVFRVPDGFVPLTELDSRDSILDYVFWDSQISFVYTPDDTPRLICLYQEYVGNRDFIVKYKGDYYVNEAKYLELIEVAVLAQEERKLTYGLGDTVEILGADKNYYITITAVEETVLGNNILYEIRFIVKPNTKMIELISIFSVVEATVGEAIVRYNDFDFIDAGMLRLEMKRDRRLDAIVLISPEYPGLTYRVLVDK